MTNTFLNRVEAERKVLRVVNKRNSDSVQLAGLSKAAIERWWTKTGHGPDAEIFRILIDLSRLCQRLSDRSHETFQRLDLEVSRDIEIMLGTLRQLTEAGE